VTEVDAEHHSASKDRVAAIDCGTNSTRLLIVDSAGRTLERLMRITRLGQGVDRENKLAPEAIARTVDILAEFRALMDRHEVQRVRVVATSAVRDAENGPDFVGKARETIGVAPEVLSGTAEGKLAYAGAIEDLEPFDGDTVVVDIGGGSTELIVGRGASIEAVSLQLGCVRLSERFLRADPPSRQSLARARQAIVEELERGESELRHLVELSTTRRLVGLAGTVSTLSALHLRQAEYSFDRLHHSVLTVASVGQLRTQLASLSAVERAGLVGMVPGREDVIVGGALVLESVMQRYSFSTVLVSERDILDGIAMSLRERP
jgi:exopolyphosphatase/guanosine-5'-triphosphate,3'-diphosphate pyrophosphatase